MTNQHSKYHNQIQRYYIQILSPVHVGNGERLRKGLDFVSDRGVTWMINRRAFEETLRSNRQALDEFVSNDKIDIKTLIDHYRINLNQITARTYNGEPSARNIFEFVRTGKGVPYLPGSSIKGSLRTVLLWTLSQSETWKADNAGLLKKILQIGNPRKAGDPVVDKAFNMATQSARELDANRDLMRVLHIGDVHFKVEDLALADVRIFNLSSETSAGWKHPRRDAPNLDKPQNAMSLAAEALHCGVSAEVMMSIDNFLLTFPQVKTEADFEQHTNLFQNLPAICNAFAKRQITRQRAFFEKYNLTPLVGFYKDLENGLANLPDGDFFLRLAMGSGWQGMTGELIENPDEMREIRRQFKLGKFFWEGLPEKCPLCGSPNIRADKRKKKTGYCKENGCTFDAPGLRKVQFPVFPKTRKIVLENGQPRYPFGWVRFCSSPPEIPSSEDRRHFAPPAFKPSARFDNQQPRRPKPAAPQISKPPKAAPEAKIRSGEKLRAEVIELDGHKYSVRLLEKDPNREVSFTRAFIPVGVGDTIEVRVVATNPAGDQVTKIEFVSKVKK